MLRIVDPKLNSPVALEAGVLALGAMPYILPAMLLINAKFLFGWEVWHTMIAFAVMMLFCLTLLRLTRLWGPKKF